MKEREKNQSLGFSIQSGRVKLDAQGLKVSRALGVRSRGSCWENEASESQVESRPGLGRPGPSRGRTSQWAGHA